jgi:hypothetical protein
LLNQQRASSLPILNPSRDADETTVPVHRKNRLGSLVIQLLCLFFDVKGSELRHLTDRVRREMKPPQGGLLGAIAPRKKKGPLGAQYLKKKG